MCATAAWPRGLPVQAGRETDGESRVPEETCPCGQRGGGSRELSAAPPHPGTGRAPLPRLDWGPVNVGAPRGEEDAKGLLAMEEGEVRADGQNGSPRASQEAGLFPRAAAPPRPR